MSTARKPLSFSMCRENHAYIEEQVEQRKKTNSRYSRSMYMDDLITHLRTKQKVKPKTELAVIKPSAKRFIPPTPLEVDSYMVERDINDPNEAQSFCDFYESNGWKVGKNKMKCWKASVRNWLKGYKKGRNSAAIKQVEHEDNLNDKSWAENLDDVL